MVKCLDMDAHVVMSNCILMAVMCGQRTCGQCVSDRACTAARSRSIRIELPGLDFTDNLATHGRYILLSTTDVVSVDRFY